MTTKAKLNDVPFRVRRLAQRVGAMLKERTYNNTYVWDGKTIAIRDHRGLLRPIYDIIHDIAHYLVAPKRRRNKPEFGLGSSPDIGSRRIDPLVSYDYAQAEEEQASLLGILLERDLGRDWKFTFSHHNWDDNRSADHAHDCRPHLMLKRFLDGKRSCLAHETLDRLIKKDLLNEYLDILV